MLNVKNDVTVLETLSLDEYRESKYYNTTRLDYKHTTDIFNKASRTTICFNGAMGTQVMYCENCDETHTNNIGLDIEILPNENPAKDTWYTSSDYTARIKNVVCKKCGSTYSIDDVKTIERARYAMESDTRIVYDRIYDDNDELVKYSLKICSMVVEKGFYSVDHVYKIVFNTKTGQTYLYNKPSNKKNPFSLLSRKVSLQNINFSAGTIDFMLNKALVDKENPNEYKLNRVKELFELIYEKISSNLGYKPKTLEEYAKELSITSPSEIYSIKNIAFFNRFPNLNPFAMAALDQYHFGIISVPKRLRTIKNISENPLKELAKAYRVKELDLFKKYFNEGDLKLYKLIYFSVFFDNREYLEDIVNSAGKYMIDGSYSMDKSIKKIYTPDNASTIFFRQLKKVMDEDSLYLLFKKYVTNDSFSREIRNLAKDFCMCRKIYPKLKFDLEYISSIIMGYVKYDSDGYDFHDLQGYIYKISFESVHQSNQKMFDFKLNTIDEYFNALSLERKSKYSGVYHTHPLILALYNDVPSCNPFDLYEMLFDSFHIRYRDRHEDELFKLDLSSIIKDKAEDTLTQIFEYNNIPNVKSLRKKILKKPMLMSALIFFNKLFTDINVINNLLDSIDGDNSLIMPINEMGNVVNNMDSEDNTSIVETYKFIKLLIENQGETITGKKLCNSFKSGSHRDIRDCYSMCETYSNLYPKNSLDLTGSIKDIHDRLVVLTGGTYRPFKKADFKSYKYSEDEFKLEAEMNGYSFKLAPNGRELAILGSELKNCVRSYADRARRKECFIVSVSHNNEYKICIELRPKSNSVGILENTDCLYSLEQAKLYANTPVWKNDEAFSVVLDWMEQNNIYNNSFDTKVPKDLNIQRGARAYEEDIVFVPVEDDDEDLYLDAVPF